LESTGRETHGGDPYRERDRLTMSGHLARDRLLAEANEIRGSPPNRGKNNKGGNQKFVNQRPNESTPPYAQRNTTDSPGWTFMRGGESALPQTHQQF